MVHQQRPAGSVLAAVKAAVMLIAVATMTVRCTELSMPPIIASPLQPPRHSLMQDLMPIMPDADVATVPPGIDACGESGASVIRGTLPERVLFATASDQPAPDAAGVLALMADRLRRDAPDAQVTVLGHTDVVGSDAYNLDLSRRRALHVLRTLVDHGLDPARLTAVAIGKRQPVADNGSAAGRARNRRVEFLVSRCMAANLGVVRAQGAAADADRSPVEVMRLDPAAGYGLATIGQVSLRPLDTDRVQPAIVAPAPAEPLRGLKPPVSVARPAPAPHYQPHALTPDARPNPLGPAVPF